MGIPWVSTGRMPRPPRCGPCVAPMMCGMLGPYTSASSRPTLAPVAASASAKFAEDCGFADTAFAGSHRNDILDPLDGALSGTPDRVRACAEGQLGLDLGERVCGLYGGAGLGQNSLGGVPTWHSVLDLELH